MTGVSDSPNQQTITVESKASTEYSFTPSLPELFACLEPENRSAKLAFHGLATEIRRSPSSFPYHEQFIIITSRRSLDVALPKNETVSSLSATELDTDDEQAAGSSEQVWQGYYGLSLAAPLEFPRLGWRIGAGRWTKRGRANGGVELLLTKPGRPQIGLMGIHARFSFRKDGAFIVSIDNPRQPSVVAGDDEFNSGERILAKRKMRICFGALSYQLKFITPPGDEDYQDHLRLFLRAAFNSQTPPRELMATPSEADFTFGNWIIQGTVGQGSFGIVSTARHIYEKKIGAAKMVVRTLANLQTVMHEIQIMNAIPKHERFSRLLDVLYERGDRWFTGPNPERVWLIFDYYPRGFSSIISVDFYHRLRLFRDIVEGLSALHQAGFIHRDIKPANLAISDSGGVILDWGQTIRQRLVYPTPGAVGTRPYLAPEMEKSEYGAAVDVFALGVVGIQVFSTRGKLQWRHVVDDKAAYVMLFTRLSKYPPSTVHGLLKAMLEWDPERRISAENAFRHACFDVLGSGDIADARLESTTKKHPLKCGGNGGT